MYIMFFSVIEVSYFFFFSSRRRHTRSKRDWSSDVCSSDLMLSPKDPGAVGITLSATLKDYALHDIPFGLWQKKDECKFSSVPTVGSFNDANRPRWIAEVKPPPGPDSPVYSELPGGAIFNMICINCHGANADSRGRQADTLMVMTGGETRVANLRDGFFGPKATPGANRQTEFAPN